MTQITSTTTVQRTYEEPLGGHVYEDFLVDAAFVGEGSALGIDAGTGYVRQLVATDTFVGMAVRTKDNSAGTNGGDSVRAVTLTHMVANVTGVTATTAPGTEVYASDGNTFTTTSAGNSSIGRVSRVTTAPECVIAIEGAGQRSPT